MSVAPLPKFPKFPKLPNPTVLSMGLHSEFPYPLPFARGNRSIAPKQKNALTLWYKDFFVYLCRPKQALMGLRDVPSNYYHEGQRSMMESVVMRFYRWLKVWLIGGYEVYGRN